MSEMLRRFSTKRKEDNETRDRRRLLNKFLEFITSSIWSIPIASFIEQQSIVFDRQQMETQVYEQIHKEYACLIDTLIECFCEDMGVASNKLTESLKLLDQQNLSMKQRISLEPLAAAQNFNVFVPMMMRKNIELQLQALQMIEFMCGLIPNVLQIEDGETLVNLKKLSPEDTERYVLISVLRQSKDEFESLKKGGQDEMQTMARESEQQRHRLEQEIRREENNLQRALTAGMTRTSASAQTVDTPLSVAAVMISQFANTSTNTEDYEDGQESGTALASREEKEKESRDSETNTDLVNVQKSTSDSQTDATNESPDGISKRIEKEKRPKTGKKEKSDVRTEAVVGSEVDRPKTGKKEKSDAQVEATTGGSDVRPKSKSGARRPSTGLPPNAAKTSDALKASMADNSSQAEEEKKDYANMETNTDAVVNDKQAKTRPKSAKRPGSVGRTQKGILTDSGASSATAEEGTEIAESKIAVRPSSRHTSRRESLDKTKSDERPSTRRSSIDKNAPKRNDSIPSDRRGASKNGNRKEAEDKPPKPPGPVREPRYPGERVSMGNRAESPGVDHGPRRRNLDDVHSHLVDRDRLNSSDLRSRAAYLRQQRDNLLRLKREERIKHMNEVTKDATERPKTAKAARGMLDQKESDEIRREINKNIQAQILTID